MSRGIAGVDETVHDAELLELLDDLEDNGILAILDAHDEGGIALSFCGDTFEPTFERFDARLLVCRLRLLRTELMDTIEELLEVYDGY